MTNYEKFQMVSSIKCIVTRSRVTAQLRKEAIKEHEENLEALWQLHFDNWARAQLKSIPDIN